MAETTPCSYCGGTQRRLVRNTATGELHGMSCACAHELPVPFVYQPEENGCGIAAVAMATQRSYADVRKLLVMSVDLSGFTDEGVNIGQLDDLLDTLGFAWRARYQNDHRLGRKRDPWPCAPWADIHLCQVRNLSNTSGHYVVLLGDGRVLDPWWGVIGGLHRYPVVHSIKSLHALPAPTPTEEP
jgi:hypothetical protein